MERGRLARFLIRFLDTYARRVSISLLRIDRVSVSYHMLLARVITRFLDTFARLVSIYLLRIDCIVFLLLIMRELRSNVREDN